MLFFRIKIILKIQNKKMINLARIMMKQLKLILLITMSTQLSFGQLSQPKIGAFNVGWGWFNLRMTGTAIAPKTVDWEVIETNSGNLVFSSACNKSVCPIDCINPFYADQYDIREKLIIGCKDGMTYRARARYSNLLEWSPWSDPIDIMTPLEPSYTGDDINILVWGNELVSYGDRCGIISKSRLGHLPDSSRDNFCYALQCDLRRILNRKVNVVNLGGEEENFDKWWISDRLAYDNIYASGYAMSLFFYGSELARMSAAPSEFGRKIDSTTHFLSNKKHPHIIFSNHYMRPTSNVPAKLQSDYLASWNNKINQLKSNEPQVDLYLWKGLDLYNIFRMDSTRFLGPDGWHLDMTEGMTELVYRTVPLILNVLNTSTDIKELNQNKIAFQSWFNNGNIYLPKMPNNHYQYQLTNAQGQIISRGKYSNIIDEYIPIPKQTLDGMILLNLYDLTDHKLYQTKFIYNH